MIVINRLFLPIVGCVNQTYLRRGYVSELREYRCIGGYTVGVLEIFSADVYQHLNSNASLLLCFSDRCLTLRVVFCVVFGEEEEDGCGRRVWCVLHAAAFDTYVLRSRPRFGRVRFQTSGLKYSSLAF